MRSVLTTVGELVGVAAVTFGLALIFVPAAFIFGGLAVALISYFEGQK